TLRDRNSARHRHPPAAARAGGDAAPTEPKGRRAKPDRRATLLPATVACMRNRMPMRVARAALRPPPRQRRGTIAGVRHRPGVTMFSRQARIEGYDPELAAAIASEVRRQIGRASCREIV